MTKTEMKDLIEVAAGRQKAGLVIRNARVVDVYSGHILEGDIALCGGVIAGVGQYEGIKEFDAGGRFAAPGFIDSHIHIESSYVTPEEIGRLLVPHGGTTIIADPHEIVNVSGLTGLNYMLDAAEETVLDIKYMLPSCVPATPFEHSGAKLQAEDLRKAFADKRIHGMGEFMDFPGVVEGTDFAIERLLAAGDAGKVIDGHSPGITGSALNAYAAAGIRTEHECATVEDMRDRISRGMYVLLRQGSACHDLENLLHGLTPENSRRCLLCSDDRQPTTILSLGHLDDHLRICVRHGVDAVTAIRMATLNAAECYRLDDRGAIAPGLRGDIVLLDDLADFNVSDVFICGEHVAAGGRYLPEVTRRDPGPVKNSFNVRDFSRQKLKLRLTGNRVHVIDILPGSVVTGKGVAQVQLDDTGDFIRDESVDIVKIAVVERHQGTGNVAVALLRGYGIREGAVALSIAHDSHNIIAVGTNDGDIAFAVENLIAQGGGILLARNETVVERMPMPVGGIMSDRSGQWVDDTLAAIHEAAHRELGISRGVEPVMTLCFMSLAVIPELKLTDMGLFDVTEFGFIPIEAEP